MNLNYGWAKGMRLKTPSGSITRPTSGKVREAVMNMLQHSISEGLFLDIFAGSGAMGLDALSRGSHGSIFVEINKKAIQALKQNITEAERRVKNNNQEVGLIKVVQADALSNLHQLLKFKDQTSILWSDPPYELTLDWVKKNLTTIKEFMDSNTIFALECAKSDCHTLKEVLEQRNIQVSKEKHYGDTSLLICQH